MDPVQLHVSPKLSCRLGWHDWSRWQDTNEIVHVIDRDFDDPSKIVDEGTHEIQRRVCMHCGMKKIRRERQ